ncbi:PHD and RING finger domain-containing protein 1-like isoform X1 [Melanotaenia boesemani]|uniref:PHD and RING finger domain-containing protein 1-like isoform X1 n=1 Tax=Melanotaenia boesemani TaxID=1250792 RepID=UPI001C05CA76|nr:PHD and RING finger domain-containing protein 1-like isoform X1 [Melanotaenia boesemani]
MNAQNAAGEEKEASVSNSEKCYICLSPFEKQTVGSLETCLHVFCLECILLWSQTANTCPVDRISFAVVHQRRCPGGDIQRKIKVKTQRKDADEEEEESSAVICEECGRSDRRDRMLMCIRCDSGYHMDCLTPSFNTGPEGDWTCPECAVIPLHTESFTLEEEISDGELTDLLAEVDETSSPSSRFRASTINRSSSFPERRRSARIQRRADSGPRPRHQTTWHVPKYLLRASRPAGSAQEPGNPSDISTASVNLKMKRRGKRAT